MASIFVCFGRHMGTSKIPQQKQQKQQQKILINSMAFARFLVIVFMTMVYISSSSAEVHYHHWKVGYTEQTRLCSTKSIVSVNAQFPGPTIYANEGDSVHVEVTNLVDYNVTIHWHGVRQLGSPWADGPAYVTQCPIQKGQSYVYKFKLQGQQGTMFWHAHVSWLRATLYGAIIVRNSLPGPFPKPYQEIPLLLGEWWKTNVEDVIHEALAVRNGYNLSDALTINGQPGFLYNCSAEGAVRINVIHGKTYLLRIVNAAMNFVLYFSVAGHSLQVVEMDGSYTKPYNVNVIVLTPGQCANVLLTADKYDGGDYFIAASPFSPAKLVDYPKVPTTALLSYKSSMAHNAMQSAASSPEMPIFPASNDSDYVAIFSSNIRSLESHTGVPLSIDRYLLYTLAYGLVNCPPEDDICTGIQVDAPGLKGKVVALAINNITFSLPTTTSLLESYYQHRRSALLEKFPDKPELKYNFTGEIINSTIPEKASKLSALKFNSNVEIVLQNTAQFDEVHPFHLHGYSFYVVGSNIGNFKRSVDEAKFNLIDPPLMNTIAVPLGGWVAIRFTADNPGVWLLHCHFEIHQSWGMSMAFVVDNGSEIPRPPDLPKC